MENFFSIGEVSKLKGVTIKALRFYDKIGLVRPAYVNSETGYRYYSLEQLLLIENIGLFKESGASLEQIAAACQGNDCVQLAKFCMEQVFEAEEKMARLKNAVKMSTQLASRIYHDKARSANSDVYYRPILTRQVISRVCNTPPTDKSTYKIYFDVYSMIRDKKLSSIYATGAVVNIIKETMELSYEKMFVEVEKTAATSEVELQTLPPGDYLCINYYESNKRSQIRKLLKLLDEQGFEPQIMIEADTFIAVTQYENPLMELQVLIS